MIQDFNILISGHLKELKDTSQFRTIPLLDHGSELFLEHENQRLLNLASNNYLGLASHDALKTAAINATSVYGTSASASRLISGNFALYDQLEKELCAFKKKPASLITGSGYSANLSILSSLAGRNSVILCDKLNHASIIDGALLSGARLLRYRHSDMDHLKYLITKHQDRPDKFLITDTVFSMDGDFAPLEDIAEICAGNNIISIIDEAHATGIFGHGRGLAHQLGLTDSIDVHMGTFSKALGSYGGYIASSRDIIDMIINKGRAFIFSTALPPGVMAANLAALKLVSSNPDKSAKLLNIAAQLRAHLKQLGFDTGYSQSQIIPVILKDSHIVLKARQKLIDKGIFTGAVRHPTVPVNTARLRISLRADLMPEHLDLIFQAFDHLASELSLPPACRL
ncbi:aminotransferase class I/II-fold pyridoxal phosphate-dependent enzyme [Desulfonatronovibrio magnus]|uniref:aminotransferase class I/II-fold pyridoxal phosphate-dependent enzyme n=1 Tax=Desulfonatronovibrio magnus TaxID=698827 RepID=UPI0005EBE285|nr:8-amino-7-oxononanoate synthase [Desulfonatronovibrio magnus]